MTGRTASAAPRTTRALDPSCSADVAASLARRLDRDDLAERIDADPAPSRPVRDRRLRRRRVQEGQERAGQRAARRPDLPGRRRPRDDGGHGRASWRDARARSSTGGRAASRSSSRSIRTTWRTGSLERAGAGAAPGRRSGRGAACRTRCSKRGITLVDTPGVGGLNAGHAAATLAFLPSADALDLRHRHVGRAVRPRSWSSWPARAAPARPCSSRRPRSTCTRSGDGSSTSTRTISRRSAWSSGRSGSARRSDSTQRSVTTKVATPRSRPCFARTSSAEHGSPPRRLRPRTRAGSWGSCTSRSSRNVPASRRPRLQLGSPARWHLPASGWHRCAGPMPSGRRGSTTSSPPCGRASPSTSSAPCARPCARRRPRSTGPTRGACGRTSALGSRPTSRRRSAAPSAMRRPGRPTVQSTIASILAEEDGGEVGAPAMTFDVGEFWSSDPSFEGRTKSRIKAGYGLVTGAKAGVELLGLVGTLLGAAIVGPAVLGVAAVYGGKEVLDERRRRLVDRRQQARTFVGDLDRGDPLPDRGSVDEPVRRDAAPDAGPLHGTGRGAAAHRGSQRRSARPRGAQGCSGPSRPSVRRSMRTSRRSPRWTSGSRPFAPSADGPGRRP